MATYGYIRVSTKEQCEDRQRLAMDDLNVKFDRIYMDKSSGKDFDREEYKKLVSILLSGDLLYIKSIDRLGRNYADIRTEWGRITKDIGVDIVVMDMPLLDTRINKDLMGTFISDLVLQILSFFSEHERAYIRSRQAEGIKAALAKGIKFGRPVKTPPDNFNDLAKRWKRGELKTKDFMKQTGLTETTLYRRLREQKITRVKCKSTIK